MSENFMFNTQNIIDTLKIRGFSLLNIPMLFIANPSVIKLNDKECEVSIPLNYLTKNHVGSMYFGVLAMGADLGCGLMATEAIRKSGKNVVLIFKDFKATFLKRAESDVHFVCKQGKRVNTLVKKAIATGERQNQTFEVLALTPKKTGKEIIAKFALTLSLKLKSKDKKMLPSFVGSISDVPDVAKKHDQYLGKSKKG
ncbi:MAG: DUF4442 domain-containing protein [Deltaproteobacteria bacterium]|nr:DUF4442 domain-containing protein [Deltaproteobacteria bacterium]